MRKKSKMFLHTCSSSIRWARWPYGGQAKHCPTFTNQLSRLNPFFALGHNSSQRIAWTLAPWTLRYGSICADIVGQNQMVQV